MYCRCRNRQKRSWKPFSLALNVKVDRIIATDSAELNEAFFQSVSAEYGEVTDESACVNISGFIEQYNDNMTRVQLDNTLYKYLIEQTSIDLPDQFLEKWFINSRAADGETKRPSHNLCAG